MKTMYDVRNLLKRFGIFIYTGHRLRDLEAMETELRELFTLRLIDVETYERARICIRHETRILQEKRSL